MKFSGTYVILRKNVSRQREEKTDVEGLCQQHNSKECYSLSTKSL